MSLAQKKAFFHYINSHFYVYHANGYESYILEVIANQNTQWNALESHTEIF